MLCRRSMPPALDRTTRPYALWPNWPIVQPDNQSRGTFYIRRSTPPALNRATRPPMDNRVAGQLDLVEDAMHEAKQSCTRTPATNVVLECLAKRSQQRL